MDVREAHPTSCGLPCPGDSASFKRPRRELGQASLAVALVGLPIVSRGTSQAPASYAGVLDTSVVLATDTCHKHTTYSSVSDNIYH